MSVLKAPEGFDVIAYMNDYFTIGAAYVPIVILVSAFFIIRKILKSV